LCEAARRVDARERRKRRRLRVITANNKLVFNAAAALVVLGALIGVGRSILAPSTTRSCGDRYANSTLFRLDRDGVGLTASDIQARVGGHGAGLIENVDVVRPTDSRIPFAMRISLRNGPASTGGSTVARPGMAFPWQPRSVENQTATCLSYQLFFHGDLEFHSGGTLPGIQGSDRSQQSQDGFATHVAWQQDGLAGVSLSLTANGETQTMALGSSPAFTFPRGRWVRVDEEVVLNAPGRDDGVLRIWVDGALAIDRRDIGYRRTPEVTISGVAADVFYGGADTTTWAPADTKIWVSPFAVSWQ
jgi:hypothetical protein